MKNIQKTNLFIIMTPSILESKFSEKFKYLFTNQFINKYELISLEVLDLTLNGDIIEEFTVDLKIDNLLSNDGDAHSIGHMLETANEDMMNFFYEFSINPRTKKFDPNISKFRVSDGQFLSVNYQMDEKHEMTIYYRISYDDYE